MARQRRYFRNLVQLPLSKFSYKVTPEQWEGVRIAQRWGEDVHIPQVPLSMQLQDFDAVPVDAHRRLRVLLPQRPRDARLGPDQHRQAALRGDARTVGPDRDHRARRSPACSASSTATPRARPRR